MCIFLSAVWAIYAWSDRILSCVPHRNPWATSPLKNGSTRVRISEVDSESDISGDGRPCHNDRMLERGNTYIKSTTAWNYGDLITFKGCNLALKITMTMTAVSRVNGSWICDVVDWSERINIIMGGCQRLSEFAYKNRRFSTRDEMHEKAKREDRTVRWFILKRLQFLKDWHDHSQL